MNTKHPALYNDSFLPIFANLLRNSPDVLDPMCGSGKISEIRQYGWQGTIQLCDIERWNDKYDDNFIVSDAAYLPFADESFSAICTSPTYGNRMADTYTKGIRFNYTKVIGRELSSENTGRMQWGEHYRIKSNAIYKECLRVTRNLLIINIKDHIRDGQIIPVTDWTISTIKARLIERIEVRVRGLRVGGNTRGLRVDTETILVFQKG